MDERDLVKALSPRPEPAGEEAVESARRRVVERAESIESGARRGRRTKRAVLGAALVAVLLVGGGIAIAGLDPAGDASLVYERTVDVVGEKLIDALIANGASGPIQKEVGSDGVVVRADANSGGIWMGERRLTECEFEGMLTIFMEISGDDGADDAFVCVPVESGFEGWDMWMRRRGEIPTAAERLEVMKEYGVEGEYPAESPASGG